MAENQSTYGLPNILELLDKGAGQFTDLARGLGSYGYGNILDLTGMGSELLGLPDPVSKFYAQKADDLIDYSLGAFKNIPKQEKLSEKIMGSTQGNIDKRINTPERDLIESMLVDPDRMKSFEPPEPESDLGKRLSEIDSLLSSASPRVPPEGRPPTPTEEKASAEESLLKEAQVEEQLFGKEKEDFRAKEEALLQGTVPTPENVQKAVNDGFIGAMKEFLNSSGQQTKSSGVTGGARDLDFYKKEFAKATGVDISGKPDKSNFLMALGLGLMQNRAGKGFNVGKILGAVGESAEKAMPKLIAAQKEAKANMIAAGKYAMQAQAKDRATAAAAAKNLKKTGGYFIVPTGGKAGLTPADYVNLADKGRYMKLSNAQLAQLEANPEFNKNFSILPGDMWGDIVKETIESQGKGGVKFLEKVVNVPMFAGAEGDYFNIPIQYADQNTVPKGQIASPRFAGSEQDAINKLQELKSSADRSEAEFKKIASALNETSLTRQDQTIAYGIQFLRGFGIKGKQVYDEDGNLIDKPTAEQRLTYYLTKLQAEEASNILQEAGKTLSDKDREMVKQIVGQIGILAAEGADKTLIVEKINNLYGRIVGAKRRNLQQAAQGLFSYGVTGAADFIDTSSAAYGIPATSTDLNFTYTTMPSGRLRLSLVGN